MAINLEELSGRIESQVVGVDKGARISPDRLDSMLNRNEDEISASFVNQVKLGEPGLDDSIARLALADADTAGEKLAAFKKRFPEGDLQVSPVTQELLFRENKADSFRKVDAGALEKFEPLNDLIDFFGGDLGAIIGEVAVSKGATSILGILSRMWAGGFFGEMGQQQIQESRGIQQQDIGEQLEQAQLQGAFSAVGGAAGMGAGKVVDAFRGGPSIPLREGADRAIQAGDRLGLEKNLTAGESTDVPLIKKLEGQSGATLPTVQRYMDERAKEITAVVQAMGDPQSAKKLLQTDALATANRREAGRVLEKAKGMQPKTLLSEGGGALKQGINEYSRKSGLRVTAAYNNARNMETPVFDVTDLKGEAQQVLDGVQFATKEGEVARAGAKLDNDVSEIANQIINSDPALPTIVSESGDVTATEQLRAWRTALYDAKTPAPGEFARESHRLAGRLYQAINNTLTDPKNTSPAFREAWEKANNMASDRFTTLDKLVVINAAKNETPAQLARRLANPREVDNLNTLKSTITPAKFAKFQDSFKFDLLEDANRITSRLDGFDKETLDVLLTPGEQNLYRIIGSQIDGMNRLGIPEILQRQTQLGAAIDELFNRKDTASISLLADMIKNNGGINSDLGKMVRAGIIERIKDQSLIKESGRTVVSPKAVEAIIKDVREKGLGRFLTTEDMRLLGDLDEFLPFIRTTGDTGTSIQAAEAAAGARGAVADVLTGQTMGTAALQTVAEHLGVGYLFTHKAHLLRGLGKKAKTSSKKALTQALAILTLAANDKGAFDPNQLEKLEVISGARNGN